MSLGAAKASTTARHQAAVAGGAATVAGAALLAGAEPVAAAAVAATDPTGASLQTRLRAEAGSRRAQPPRRPLCSGRRRMHPPRPCDSGTRRPRPLWAGSLAVVGGAADHARLSGAAAGGIAAVVLVAVVLAFGAAGLPGPSPSPSGGGDVALGSPELDARPDGERLAALRADARTIGRHAGTDAATDRRAYPRADGQACDPQTGDLHRRRRGPPPPSRSPQPRYARPNHARSDHAGPDHPAPVTPVPNRAPVVGCSSPAPKVAGIFTYYDVWILQSCFTDPDGDALTIYANEPDYGSITAGISANCASGRTCWKYYPYAGWDGTAYWATFTLYAQDSRGATSALLPYYLCLNCE